MTQAALDRAAHRVKGWSTYCHSPLSTGLPAKNPAIAIMMSRTTASRKRGDRRNARSTAPLRFAMPPCYRDRRSGEAAARGPAHQSPRLPDQGSARFSATNISPMDCLPRISTRNLRSKRSSSRPDATAVNGPALSNTTSRLVACLPNARSNAQPARPVSGVLMSAMRIFRPSSQTVSPSTTQVTRFCAPHSPIIPLSRIASCDTAPCDTAPCKSGAVADRIRAIARCNIANRMAERNLRAYPVQYLPVAAIGGRGGCASPDAGEPLDAGIMQG